MWLDRLFDMYDAKDLYKLLDRHTRAMERIADSLESLLPSPLTSSQFQDNTLKPKGEDSFKVYGDKEAFYDEVKKRREYQTQELDNLADEVEQLRQ